VMCRNSGYIGVYDYAWWLIIYIKHDAFSEKWWNKIDILCQSIFAGFEATAGQALSEAVIISNAFVTPG